MKTKPLWGTNQDVLFSKYQSGLILTEEDVRKYLDPGVSEIPTQS